MARPLRVTASAAAPSPPKWRSMTLPVTEFLDRLVEHVPVKGLHMVRAYGL
jgi:hypothetical protein